MNRSAASPLTSFVIAALALGAASCRPSAGEPAALILTNARAYTLSWNEPSPEGVPASNAPWDSSGGWRHDATAVAVRGGRIVYVGSDTGALALRGDSTAE
ncbi:MAG: hypothetical protein IPF47_25430 [Gemmatimonadetes bacterium]|nr:hypothetical protein [Gemmatimonadota bacterium]